MSKGLWIVAISAAAAVLLPAVAGSNYMQGLFVLVCVYSMLALSANLVFGYLGYTTFGQAAFFGLGGYTTVLLSTAAGVNFWAAALIAIAPGMLLGALVGAASLRVGGAYFAITSLTVAEILRLIADNWIGLTRGPMGLLLPRPSIPFLNDMGLSFSQYYLGITVLAAGIVFAVVWRLLRSPAGRAWEAIRESSSLAEAVGIGTLRYRVLNVALAGGIASLAGALVMPKVLVASPDLFGNYYSAIALLMVILGGRGSLLGSLIGGAMFALLPELLRSVDEYRLAIFAALLLVFVLLRPAGIVSLLAPLAERWARKPVARAALAGIMPLQAEPTSVPLVELDAVSKRFRGLTAVDGVSFSVKGGEVVGLMGPNGAGKTTCLSMISGFLKPSSGRIVLAGGSLANVPPHEIAKRGMVRTFQQTVLFPNLTALENVLIATHLAAAGGIHSPFLRPRTFASSEARCAALAAGVLDFVGLSARADMKASDLAYGEQRFLSVALALAARPKVLLLDEPAAGLNPTEASALTAILRKLRATGVAVVLIEHNVPMMMEICDRLVVLHHGVKIAEGTPAEIGRNEAVQEAYFGTAVREDEHAAG